MDWHILWSTFIIATFKFLFSGIPGAKLGVPFWEIVLSSGLGALCSAAFFFFLSEQVIRYFEKRRNKTNIVISRKRFKTNRVIIRIKQSFGILGITFFAPLFLSVPIGSIICAKFYGDNKSTFPLMAMWIGINSIVITLIWYGIFG